jgi:dolichyl-phosphate-mannose-protein mannosyltransferase
MNLSKFKQQHSRQWLAIATIAIFLVSLILRFWGLDRFNTLVFDEVYYAKFANSYLINKPFFNAHPPLSQYIIAVGIWIGSHLPFGQNAVNSETGSLLSPWDYRWLNALTGAFIPLVVGAIAYQLTRRHLYAFLATLLIAADGLFLVESRYALNNIYLVILGLLGHLFLLLGIQGEKKPSWLWLTLAGTSLGASTAIKWNGLWFLLGIYLILSLAWSQKIWQKFRSNPDGEKLDNYQKTSRLSQLTKITLPQLITTLIITPILVYSLLWIPHLQLNPTPNFWQMQYEILSYHERVKSGPDVHPYCSNWYSWPLMIRPIAYFYKSVENKAQPDPVLPSLPARMKTPIIYDVHAMGNPALYLFSFIAVFLLIFLLVHRLYFWLKYELKSGENRKITQDKIILFPPDSEIWLGVYLIGNWLANLLPWIKVTRCVFLYHYMGSSIFAALALAWWLERWIYSPKKYLRAVAITGIFLVLTALVFWLPLYLGLPLSRLGWQLRMWLPSWV